MRTRFLSPALLMAASVALLTPASAMSQGWDNSTQKDEMSGSTSAYATSAMTAPTQPMGFPYNDVKGWLGFGCDGQSEWAFIGFSGQPNLNNTEPQDGGYSTFSTRLKWDDAITTVKMAQKWGTRFLSFQSSDAAIRHMLNSRTALLELDWYGPGRTYFRFSLTGASKAIAKARKQCGE